MKLVAKQPTKELCDNMNMSEQEIIEGQYSLLEKGYIERHVVNGKEFFALTEEGRLYLGDQTENIHMHG